MYLETKGLKELSTLAKCDHKPVAGNSSEMHLTLKYACAFDHGYINLPSRRRQPITSGPPYLDANHATFRKEQFTKSSMPPLGLKIFFLHLRFFQILT